MVNFVSTTFWHPPPPQLNPPPNSTSYRAPIVSTFFWSISYCHLLPVLSPFPILRSCSYPPALWSCPVSKYTLCSCPDVPCVPVHIVLTFVPIPVCFPYVLSLSACSMFLFLSACSMFLFLSACSMFLLTTPPPHPPHNSTSYMAPIFSTFFW